MQHYRKNQQLFDELTSQFTKSRKQDRKDRILETLEKELDVRERWLNIRELKRKYTPNPFHNTDRQNKHVHYRQRAQQAALHLSTQQWGPTTPSASSSNALDSNMILKPICKVDYLINPPTIDEIIAAIKKT